SVRLGHAITADSETFAALPSLVDGSVTFVPFTLRDHAAGRPGTTPLTHALALERGRSDRIRFAQRWVDRAPKSAAAHEASSIALEATGEVLDRPHAPTALSEARIALELATEGQRRVSLAVGVIRLDLKRGEFRQAGHAADSLLRAHPSPSPPVAAILAP